MTTVLLLLFPIAYTIVQGVIAIYKTLQINVK